ncbi:MAG: DEAD/DEAH box helicase family protein [Verrucomicrobiales bacterium]|nr:DEAD/DEAH box helicase family protein [Verrucomicrobiales bacterium]
MNPASLPTPEAHARLRIDRSLTAAGWLVQDKRHLNLHAAPGVAVCETDVEGGFADYMLFVDARAIGVLEAKAASASLVGVSEESELYARAALRDFQRWADPLPFTYESNGGETRFRNLRDPRSRSRFVFSVHRPETLREWTQQPATLRARLTQFPPLEQRDLRDCQVDAIAGLDRSFAGNRPRALVQMATGSGKTWMAVTECYRLIKFANARRILFLVDRGNLGRQAKREFDGWRSPYTQRLFTDEYIVQRLEGTSIEPRAKIVISTIQRLYSALTGKPIDDEADERSTYEATGDTDEPRPVQYNATLPPETFDIILVDECHRSIYNLWRGVLDYFDAFQIGLTATPTAHTLGYFNQNLVSSYTHEQAVLDKVNVGYDIYRIRTKLTEEGATVERGNHLEKIERRTRRKRWEKLKDDFKWQGGELDRSVVSDTQIRTVLTHFRDALFTKMFPHRSGDWIPKTLVYAKDDAHADRIVDITRDVFGEGNDFCKKITYRAGSKKTAEDLIAEFRTSPQFRVAVTVDMIATGTDIKPLEVVLFLRDVRSAMYYEQMKGRGTRTIDPHELRTVTPDAKAKTCFVLVDAVGVTQSAKSNSRPIERAPNVSFEKLLAKVARGNRADQVISSLASRLIRLDALLEPADRESVRARCGLTPADLAKPLGESVDPDRHAAEVRKGRDGTPLPSDAEPTAAQMEQAAAVLKEAAVKPFHDPDLRTLLVELQARAEITVDHLSPDTILAGTGYDEEKARGYIENFEQFLKDNRDRLLALQILYNRPHAQRHLTYDVIRELAKAMEGSAYHLAPAEVWKCYARLRADRVRTPEPGEALTNLISLVRFATGQQPELAPFPEVARQRFAIWLTQQETAAGEPFTAEQRAFLTLIAEEIGANAALETRDLDHGTLKSRGGLPRALALFGKDRLSALLDELNIALAA